MHGERVLVTGGAGFIGSNLANYLAETNEVVVVDDQSLGTAENLSPAVEFHDRSVLEDDLPTDVDVVFHLAALSSLTMHEGGVENLREGIKTNVEGFANVVEQARQDGCETVVYSSTSSVYGSRTETSSENLDVESGTGYIASKLARERYGEYFANAHGMNMAGMRFFSVYQGFGGTEAHKEEYANIVSQFAHELANGRPPKIYGDGTHTRDFVHVDDVVRGLELAADHELTGTYNLGTGIQYSANEVVELLNDGMGTDIDPEYVDNPIPEHMFVHGTLADPSKMAEATGWEPEVSFEEGIERICAQYS